MRLCLLLACALPLLAQFPIHRERADNGPRVLEGKLVSIDDHKIVLAAPDSRQFICQRTAKTRFYRADGALAAADLRPGDELSVEATEEKDGSYSALKVILEKRAETSPAAKPAEPDSGVIPGHSSPKAGSPARPPAGVGEMSRPDTEPAPPAAHDPSDPGPPVLRRGIHRHATSAEASEDEDQSSSAAAAREPEPEPTPAEDPLILKAREAAVGYAEGLPDYVCAEYMARFQSSRNPPDWKPLDIVSANLVWEKGRESYRDVAINGKAIKKSIEETGGSWSTGEFGTILLEILAPFTAADFGVRGSSSSAGVPSRVYDFSVDKTHSRWRVQTLGQVYVPAYKGAIWIEPSTGRVLRIEMQARGLPEEFPMDTVETAIDYQKVHIGEKDYLLPVHAETLSCQRGTSMCSRNVIDFRNYHKFQGESSITFK